MLEFREAIHVRPPTIQYTVQLHQDITNDIPVPRSYSSDPLSSESFHNCSTTTSQFPLTVVSFN